MINMVCDQKSIYWTHQSISYKVMLFFLTRDLAYNKTLFAFEVLELLYSLVKDSFSALDKSIFKYIFYVKQVVCFWVRYLT